MKAFEDNFVEKHDKKVERSSFNGWLRRDKSNNNKQLLRTVLHITFLPMYDMERRICADIGPLLAREIYIW